MKINGCFSTHLITVFILLITTSSYAETLKIAAIDWCPQICINEEKPGYAVELVEKAFENSGFNVEIKYFPWSRAIRYVNSGEFHALLAPAKKEAPELRYPENAIGFQSMCFFTAKENSWQYKGESSLAGLQIGIAADTSIEELNHYIANNSQQFQFQPYHERYVEQNINKLGKNRMDAFLFTKNTTNHIATKYKLKEKIKEAGCVTRAPIYLAFTPNSEVKNKTHQWMMWFDNELSALKKSGYLETLLNKYEISI